MSDTSSDDEVEVNNHVFINQIEDLSTFVANYDEIKKTYKTKPYLNNDGFHMEEVINKLYEKTLSRNVIFTTGVGNHQMSAGIAYAFLGSHIEYLHMLGDRRLSA